MSGTAEAPRLELHSTESNPRGSRIGPIAWGGCPQGDPPDVPNRDDGALFEGPPRPLAGWLVTQELEETAEAVAMGVTSRWSRTTPSLG